MSFEELLIVPFIAFVVLCCFIIIPILIIFVIIVIPIVTFKKVYNLFVKGEL